MITKVSVDLETLSLRGDALIVSIGAVKFKDGVLGETFERTLDIANGPGGVIDASTVMWWMQQSQEARDRVFGPDVVRTPLINTLVEFSEWLGFTDDLPEGEYPRIELWARGNKDQQWLESAYDGVGLKYPWTYSQWFDQRTWCTPFWPFLPDYPDVGHTALGDAIYQAECVINVDKRLQSCGAFIGDAVPVPLPRKTGMAPELGLLYDPAKVITSDADIYANVTLPKPYPGDGRFTK